MNTKFDIGQKVWVLAEIEKVSVTEFEEEYYMELEGGDHAWASSLAIRDYNDMKPECMEHGA